MLDAARSVITRIDLPPAQCTAVAEDLTSGVLCAACLSSSPLVAVTTAYRCTAGFAWQEGSCAPCDLGSAQPGVGLRSNATLLPQCATCQPGSVSTSVASAACTPCPPGSQWGSPGGSACAPCQAGTAQLLPGQAQCDTCPPGHVSSTINQTACAPCAPGSYTDGADRVQCVACPRLPPPTRRRAATRATCAPGSEQLQAGGVACCPCALGWATAAARRAACASSAPPHVHAAPRRRLSQLRRRRGAGAHLQRRPGDGAARLVGVRVAGAPRVPHHAVSPGLLPRRRAAAALHARVRHQHPHSSCGWRRRRR